MLTLLSTLIRVSFFKAAYIVNLVDLKLNILARLDSNVFIYSYKA